MTSVRRLGVALFLLFFSPSPVHSLEDYRTRIAVITMRNTTGDTRYDAVCQAVTETVALGLKLLGMYMVVDSVDDPALLETDTSSLEAIGRMAESSRYDEVLFGDASREGTGPLTFRLSLFNNKEGIIKQQSTAEAATILDVFDAADEITIDLLSRLSSIHIGFGSIEVKNLSQRGTFTVYLGGNRIRNPKSELRKVLNGRYTITIHQDRLLGDTEIYKGEIEVFEDKSTTVSFSIPAATPQETAFLEEQRNKVMTYPADPKDIKGLLGQIAAFQELSRKADFDPALAAIKDQTLAEAGAQATSLLQQAMKDADSLYYGRNPDFQAARGSYQSLSRLVNDVYEYSLVYSGGEPPLSAPTEVAHSADGSLFVLDGTYVLNLRVVKSPQQITRTQIMEGIAGSGRLAADASSNVYCTSPGRGTLLLYDRDLNRLRDVQIPGYKPPFVPGEMPVAVSDDGLIYLIDSLTPFVFKPGQEPEKEIEAGLADGLGAGGISAVSSLFFDSEGFLNAFSGVDGRLARFDALGTLQSTVTFASTEEKSRATVDGLGYFYITLPSWHVILKYSPKGELIASYGKYGVNPGEYAYPQGIAAAPDGSLFVADSYNNRIQFLALTSPPVLLPEVAQYGMLFTKREETAGGAQQRLEIVTANLKIGNIMWPLAGFTGLVAAAGGATVTGGYFLGALESAYRLYTTETVPSRVYLLDQSILKNWMYSQISELGALFALGGATAYLTSSLLTSGDYAVAQSQAITEEQALSLDETYEFDAARYRSLAATEGIGFWTGVFPPLFAGALWATTAFIPQLVPYSGLSMEILLPAAVAVPPIWSHLYAGKFHVGLLTAGLAADAAAAGAIFIRLSRPTGWAPSELNLPFLPKDPVIYPFLNDAWKLAQRDAVNYLAAAALGIRLAAGLYDTARGWIESKDYNLYRAIKKVAPDLSFQAIPGAHLADMGVALTLRY